jgi:hypothetical protein
MKRMRSCPEEIDVAQTNQIPPDRFSSGMAVVSHALNQFEAVAPADIETYVAQYSCGYLALRSLIRDRTDPSNEVQLLAAGYAVYGWMPTILKKVGRLAPLSQFVRQVRGLSYHDALPLIEQTVDQEGGAVFRSLNNSVVGTSKLLHFLSHGLFPIWDSRIARLFGYKYQVHSTPTVYLEYFKLLHRWRESGGSVSREVTQIMQTDAPEDDPLSPIRLIEYVLFLASGLRYGFGPDVSAD